MVDDGNRAAAELPYPRCPVPPWIDVIGRISSCGTGCYELTDIRKDGSRFPAIVSIAALSDAQGAIIGYLLIGTDNTARKRAEEALLKATDGRVTELRTARAHRTNYGICRTVTQSD
jgi:PAS domain-containing protein